MFKIIIISFACNLLTILYTRNIFGAKSSLFSEFFLYSNQCTQLIRIYLCNMFFSFDLIKFQFYFFNCIRKLISKRVLDAQEDFFLFIIQSAAVIRES